MSTYVVSAGRLRVPAIAIAVAIAIALVTAVAIAVLGVPDAPRADSSGARPTAPGVAPTPDWLRHYLNYEAADGTGSVAGGVSGTRPVNPGLR